MTGLSGGQPPLQHVVLLKFPQALTAAEDAEMRAMVATWPDAIGSMDELRFGGELSGERSRGYQYLLFTVFADADALASYVAHPVHREFVAWLDARACERLAFDYHLDASTRFV
ncbi:MAG: Dabb family protein [Nocardioidaceae bacterium]|nr:Dabb family protein [Nocardioidaceae bacterium]